MQIFNWIDDKSTKIGQIITKYIFSKVTQTWKLQFQLELFHKITYRQDKWSILHTFVKANFNLKKW